MSFLLPLLLTLAPGIDFDTEIIPLLTKAGCNAGACHGAAAGRGGFQLSLLGSDPAGDYDRIVRELEGRRVNLARPAASLILAKPGGDLDHEGGVRIEDGTPAAARMRAWLEAGAQRLRRRTLERFEVTPRDAVVARPDAEVRLRATATFNDGTREDVTAWTAYTSADSTAAEVLADGQVQIHRRGQHTLIARFLNRVVAVRLTVPLGETRVDLTNQPRFGFIDDEVLATLTALRLPVAPPADDATFLRRVRLDLTGRLPAVDEVQQFLADRSPDKRAKVVDRLLASDDFVTWWTLHWAQLFRVRSAGMGPEGAAAFHAWLREQVRQNTPFDKLARTLLVAEGDSFQHGPANFSRAAGDARTQAEFVTESLLGVRLRCANCHDHPLDRWTQDDYHGLAAVFARLERGRQVRLADRGDVTHPRTGEAALPRIPGERFLPAGSDGRGELAAWLTDPKNPYFAQAAVNRLWKSLFGRGLVEPVDDLRATNPASHPRLLERLAEDFVQHGYDVRRTLRQMALSAAYGRGRLEIDGEKRGGEGARERVGETYYAQASARPLSAEVLADALADVTGVPNQHGSLPLGTRAVALVDGMTPSPALDVLGRCVRDGTCGGGTAIEKGLAAKLHLTNGELVNAKLTAPAGRLSQRLTAEADDQRLLTEFYLRALGREPSAAERTWFGERFASAKTPDARVRLWEDLLWGLLNCQEFVTNH